MNFKQALDIPLIAPTNCQYTSGLYGLPKFKQLVIAEGTPPEQMMFLAASATAIAQPSSGSALTILALQSTVIAKALLVPLTLTTPASLGALVPIFMVPTIESYCS